MTMNKFLLFLTVCVISACAPTPTKFGASGGTASPIIPASWTVPAWFIDPANSSGTASDNNNCTTSATACLTWHEINDHRWGCQGSPTVCPRLQQNTAIEFLSSQTNDNDPVYFFPAIEAGAVIQIFGPLGATQQVASGVLSNVTAKNRATPQLLLAQSGATAPQQLVVNSTHPSLAWTYKLSSGSIYSMTEPSTAVTLPTSVCGTPVDTWTNGDSVVVYQPVTVNIPSIGATWSEASGTLTNSIIFLHNINVGHLSGSLTRFTNSILGNGQLLESSATNLITPAGGRSSFSGVTYCNVSMSQGFRAVSPGFAFVFNGGSFDTAGTDSFLSNSYITNDAIIGGNVFISPGLSRRAGSATTISGGGPAYVETSKTLAVETAFDGTGGIWWGPGTINIIGTGRFSYTSTAATNLLVGALQLNGGTTGNSLFTLANVDTICGGITVNKANLDTVASATCATTGFGGLAFNPVGGEFVATSTIGF
jgi:hypothetical protein